MKIKNIILFFSIMCLLLSPSFLMGQNIKKVTLSEDPWPPYTIGKPGKAPEGGFAVEFSNEIFNRINVEVDLMLFPWKRCLQQMKKGQRDGLMLLTINAERLEYMEYTDSIMKDQDLLWYSPKAFKAKWGKNFEWNTFKDLKPYQIGNTSGFNYGKAYKEALKDLKLKVQYANTDLQNFNKLVKKRTDIFICNETVANAIFKKKPKLKRQLAFASKPFKSVQFHMSFSKKSPAIALIPKINKAISQMKQDGTIDKILGR